MPFLSPVFFHGNFRHRHRLQRYLILVRRSSLLQIIRHLFLQGFRSYKRIRLFPENWVFVINARFATLFNSYEGILKRRKFAVWQMEATRFPNLRECRSEERWKMIWQPRLVTHSISAKVLILFRYVNRNNFTVRRPGRGKGKKGISKGEFWRSD